MKKRTLFCLLLLIPFLLSGVAMAASKITRGDIELYCEDPAVILTPQSTGDTGYWFGVREDSEGDNDDPFMIGVGRDKSTGEVFELDKDGNLAINTIDTGEGQTDVFPMDQPTRTTDSPEYAGMTIKGDADIEGIVTATGGNSTNWNTAYGWGNHASAGYLTSFTETDPVFAAWDKSTGIFITESQISDLKTYLTGNQTVTLSGDAAGSGETNIPVTVADDSHDHIIGNVDGLQAILDGKSESSHNHAIDELSNVTITDNAIGELLKWNGSAWVNNTLTEAGIAAFSHTQAASTIPDFDAEVSNNSSVAANTAKITYPSSDSTKVGHISVTQSVDLDTIESDVTANNAKITNATHTGEVTGSGELTVAPNVIDADNLKVTGNGAVTEFLRSNGDGTFTWAEPGASEDTWRDIDDVPVDGMVDESISSNWAYDHESAVNPHSIAAGNDLDLSGSTLSLEAILNFITEITRDSGDLTLSTTTSGNIILNPVGGVGIGITLPTAKVSIVDSATVPPLHITARSSAPTSPSGNDLYLDDGTNTESGKVGWRIYNGSAWTDVGGSPPGIDISTPDLTGNSYAVPSTSRVLLINDDDADVTGTVVVGLPVASTFTGIILYVKKMGASQIVQLDGNLAETIDNYEAIDLTTQNQAITIVSNGSNWLIL